MAESHMTERIWGLTLEIFCLLTGETFPKAKPDDRVTITLSPPPSLTPARHTMKKILKVTKKITDLLIGEMESSLEVCLEVKAENEEEPVMGESGYSGLDGDLCPDVKMKPFRVTPVRSPQREYEDESAAEMGARSDEEESSHVIGADPGDALISHMTPEEEEENLFVKIKEEEIPLQIGPDGRYSRNKTILSHGEMEDDDITAESIGALTTQSSHPALSPADLFSHLSTHSGYRTVLPPRRRVRTSERPCCCSKCGKRFPYISALMRHERIHTGEKPYECSICGKCFSIRPHLVAHERIHTGEKPFTCSECGRCFSRKYLLLKHERLHRGEKPYSCSECGRCFSDKSNLTNHERVHTGEKPYSCSECGKCFSQKSTLNRHRRGHTEEKPY